MKFRKKPVVIDAIRFEYTGDGMRVLQMFVGADLGIVSKARRLGALAEAEIVTLEDGNDRRVKHIATEGDWIIKGVQGEFYPCKPDIFEATYEALV